MGPELLFLHRLDRLAILSKSQKEGDLVDMAAILRQLFLDKVSLVDAVNVDKINLEFKVGNMMELDPSLYEGLVFSTIENAVDAEAIGLPMDQCSMLNRDEFFQHPVMIVEGDVLTIKDVVKYAAVAAGGVHFDPTPKPEFEKIHAMSQQWIVRGLPFGIRMLCQISRVALRGLAPLQQNVLQKLESEQG